MENESYLREQIVTYLGNKRALLHFIGEAVATVRQKLGGRKLSCLDAFSGSGIVSRYLKQHASHIIANDLEAYSAIINRCYLSNKSDLDLPALEHHLQQLRHAILHHPAPGFIAATYAPKNDDAITPEDRVFYTRQNAVILDTAAQYIHRTVPDPLRPYLLAPLLAEASIHANTSGVFKGFYKNDRGCGAFGGRAGHALTRIMGAIEPALPVLSDHDCTHSIHQENANTLVRSIPETDLAYLDPPYNQHPYGSNYFMLNLLANYTPPEDISPVSGIPAAWNRSAYNKSIEAENELLRLIDDCPSKYILLSYNSEGFISQKTFRSRLQTMGTLTVSAIPYNTFRGSRNLRNRPIKVTEYLYLLEKA